MKEEVIQYRDGDVNFFCKLFHDKNRVSEQTIMFFPAFEGLRPFIFDYAKSVAAQGYTTFVVDMYGEAIQANSLDECLSYLKPFYSNRELARHRASLAFEKVRNLPMVKGNKIGAMGFCFGGLCVLELARAGHPLMAGVSAHGNLAKSNLPTHPIKTKLLILHGYQDPMLPPTAFSDFVEEMNTAGCLDWTFVAFGDAKHSFTDPKTGSFDRQRETSMGRVYNAYAAKSAYRYALDFFDLTLRAKDNA